MCSGARRARRQKVKAGHERAARHFLRRQLWGRAVECFRCWAQWRRTARGCRELLRRLLANEAGLVVAAWRELTVEALPVGMENEHRAQRVRARTGGAGASTRRVAFSRREMRPRWGG